MMDIDLNKITSISIYTSKEIDCEKEIDKLFLGRKVERLIGPLERGKIVFTVHSLPQDHNLSENQVISTSKFETNSKVEEWLKNNNFGEYKVNQSTEGTLDLYNVQTFRDGIERWKNEQGLSDKEIEGRRIAAEKIIKAFVRNETKLDLSLLYLTSLPAEIGYLTSLKEIQIYKNDIKLLPDEIGKLRNLTKLEAYSNKLESFPPSIWNLTNLKVFSVGSNNLCWLSPLIGNLTSLTGLCVRSNKLTFLPNEMGNLRFLNSLNVASNNLGELPCEIGNLTSLEYVFIDNNPELNNLPLSFSNLQQITDLNISKTKIPREQKITILEAIKKKRAINEELLPWKLNFWKAYGTSYLPLSFLNLLTPQEKGDIYKWLIRLEKTPDFAKSQEKLAKLVCDMLEGLSRKERWKEAFFAQVSSNNEKCEDRAAMDLNELYTSWLLFESDKHGLLPALPTFIGLAKTIALRKYLSQMISSNTKEKTSMSESVEIFLYYETILKNTLGLETAIYNMSHAFSGKKKWIDEKALSEFVNNNYVEELIELDSFRDKLKQEKEIPKLLEDVRSSLHNQMSILENKKIIFTT